MDGLKARLSFDAVAYDYDDEYLTIDTDTHTININNVSRLFGVQYDGNSKLIKFRISNKLSDIQKMQDSIVYINWIDSKGVKGQSIAINKTINNDTCEFAWKVPFDALKNSGVLHFAMSAVMTKNSSSVIDQRWSTQIASVITPDGIYIKSYTPSSEEEDRIAQIYNELSDMINKQNEALVNSNIKKDISFENSQQEKYINNGGVVGSHPSYRITTPFSVLKGQIVVVKTAGSSGSSSVLAEYSPTQPYKVLQVCEQNTPKEYIYKVPYDMKMLFCYDIRTEYYGYILFNVNNTLERLENLEKIPVELNNNNYLYMIKKMAVVGDSLSSGEIIDTTKTPKVVKDCYDYSWLSDLTQSIGCEKAHYSKGGLTTKSWVENVGGYKDSLLNDKKSDCYFIALGTNDVNSKNEFSLGDVSDAKDTNSFVGYYKQIIELIHEKNNHAIIYCVSLYENIESSLEYSNMISQISKLYDYCIYLDVATPLSKNNISRKNDDIYGNDSHFTTVGYMAVASIIKSVLSSLVVKNINKYKYYGLYNE